MAERSLAADLSDDWVTFAEAVEEELRSWDIHLERLQATAATRPWKARKQAERRSPASEITASRSTCASARRAPPHSRSGRSNAGMSRRPATSSRGTQTSSPPP